MKKGALLILLFFCLSVGGCSVPTAAPYKEVYSFTKQEKKIKGTFGKKRILVKDFRENEMYIEDMEVLKEDAEKYIAAHPELDEAQKANLRELKVTAGENKEQVRMLLGEPDKVMNAGANANYGASEIWVYKISKIRIFTVFIIPVFPVHEGYYLYFKGDILGGIERHYLEQTIRQGPGRGILDKTKGSTF